DALAVVGAPDPGVVDDGVPGVDHHAGGRLAGARAADPDEHVLDGDRVGRVVAGGAVRADLHQGAGVDRSGVDQETGQPYAVDVGDLQGGDAVVGDQGGVAEAEDDRARPVDPDRLVDV